MTHQHDVVKRMIGRLNKDKKLQRWFDEVLDSTGANIGLPKGTKISQLLSNLILSLFDFDVKNCFNILQSPSTVSHYTQRYISEKIDQARTIEDFNEISKGSIYLANKYHSYIKNVKLYYRYADDFVVLHDYADTTSGLAIELIKENSLSLLVEELPDDLLDYVECKEPSNIIFKGEKA